MSVIKFLLKNDHISLVKQLNWDMSNGVPSVHTTEPFSNEDTKYQNIALILGDIPHIEGSDEEWGGKQYDDEQKEKMDKLFDELPTALDIIMFNGNFEIGSYKTKSYVRDWKLKK